MNKASERLRVEHIITGLKTGGAEMMLLKLLSAAGRNWEPEVISLSEEGLVGPRIRALGIPVRALGMKRISLSPKSVLNLLRWTRSFEPELIQGWMYHGNLMASLAAIAARRRVPVLWNIRQTLYDLARERRATALVIRTGALLSRLPAAIIYNSHTSAKQHEDFGYMPQKRVVIPNGFDCNFFRPDADARKHIRQELGINEDAILIGLIGRYHPMKDHRGFLRAAGQVLRACPNVRFLLAGNGVVHEDAVLAKAIAEEGLLGRLCMLGERCDTERLNSALDIACSASAWGEGFSNSIGEAMACGVPCVVTDIGDSALIVGDTGRTVTASNSDALARAVIELIRAGSEHRRNLGAAARRRVEAEFSLASVTRRYDELYHSMVRPAALKG